MGETGCVFCRVVAELREAPECPNPGAPGQAYRKLADLSASVAILAPDQRHRGYTLVVSRTHATELFDLSEADSVRYYQDMVRVARAVAAAFRPRKLNYAALGNAVPHLHWHVLPRYADDPHPLRPPWETPHPPALLSEAEYAVILAAIRPHLV
jgi:diadenosine tetraphosphate (Ap4A) HIT family hydrolase